MKALVTGGGGFLGLAIVRQLRARGDDVVTMARGAYPALAAMGVTHHQGDVSDAGVAQRAMEGCDVVFHVAAKAGVWGTEAAYRRANIDGTRTVLEACKQLGVTRLVHTSTPSVTFDGGDAVNANETLPYPSKHLFHYGATKAEAERLVLAANGTSLRTTALRPHLIYGPGDPHIVPRMVQRHRVGRLRIVGDGTNRVDMTYVENGAHAHLLAATELQGQGRNAGKAYFISDNEPVVPWQWLSDVFTQVGLPPLEKRISYQAARTVGAVCEAMWSVLPLSGEPPMTRFVAAQLGTSHFYDLKNARDDFGYQPLVSPADAKTATIEWVRANLSSM
jgi:2-alkyl-3-oxoalkanoate reductase